MFFTESRQQFFKPLTSKYREVVVECVRLLYTRLYSSMADYGHALKREQLIEIFQEAITRAPEMEVEDEKEVVIMCRSGQRSAAAVNALQQQGFENLYKKKLYTRRT